MLRTLTLALLDLLLVSCAPAPTGARAVAPPGVRQVLALAGELLPLGGQLVVGVEPVIVEAAAP